MRLKLYSALLVLSCFGFCQNELSGYVTDAGLPIHGAHIYNHQSKVLTITNPQGEFSILAKGRDSIQVSYVGYEPISLKVDSLLLSEKVYISLKTSSIVLEEVRVLFPTYSGFKEIILETNPIDSSFVVYGLDQVDYSKVSFAQPPSTKDPEMEQAGVGFGARFDMEGLTKRGKEKKKYRKLKAQETLRSKASYKFNRKWVAEVTSLEGDRLTDFIAFCDFKPQYIVETPTYILQEDIMVLLGKFLAKENDEEEERFSPGA